MCYCCLPTGEGRGQLWSVWRSVVASIDIVTALCAAFNFAYFARRFVTPRNETPSRRAAVAVLTVVSLGAFVESVALLVLAAESAPVVLSSGSWALVRALSLAGTAGIAVLVAARMAGR